MFNLSAEQMEAEPADELFTNLYIYGQLAKKQEAIKRQEQRNAR